jgi:hypothetical protein
MAAPLSLNLRAADSNVYTVVFASGIQPARHLQALWKSASNGICHVTLTK